jgi:oxidation protein CepF
VDAEPALSMQEICGLCTNLLLAGHESTSGSAALSVIGLLEQPEQLRLMLADSEMLAKGIEELTRIRTILIDGGTNIPRLATEDVEVVDGSSRACLPSRGPSVADSG